MKLFKTRDKVVVSFKTNVVDNKDRAIKILGSGCAKCTNLEKKVVLAIKALGLNHEISHIKDYAEIASYGVMSTPALVVNNVVVSCGKVLTVDEVKAILMKVGLNDK